MRWDPDQYGRFAGERGRPFFDLVARIAAEAPETIVDLGCGPGELTLWLARRWPEALVRGVDASVEMIERAPRDGSVQFSVDDAAAFDATGVDVLVSNAMLQWLPGHERLLERWARQLNDGGWLAFQVPANLDAPSHRLMRELAESPEWRERLHGVLRGADSVSEPAEYLDLLAGRGMRVDAWQTEYQHVLQGSDPVLEWMRGTGLRPALAALSVDDGARFAAEYAALLQEAYPSHAYGTVLGFQRTFVVAEKV